MPDNTTNYPASPAPAIGWACVECFILSHDSSYAHSIPTIDPHDIAFTDWTCTECLADWDAPADTCTGCDDSRTEHTLTVGGTCELGGHDMPGYWDAHAFIIHE